MTLTTSDIKYLKQIGYLDEDIPQIKQALTCTAYEINEQPISQKKALELLNRHEFISGTARSAFHHTAARQTKDANAIVIFDASNLFR